MYLPSSLYFQAITVNMIQGSHRSLYVACLTRFNVLSSKKWCRERFASQHRLSSSMTSVIDSPPSIVMTAPKKTAGNHRVQEISKAMKAYLERARAHEEFVSQKTAEFEIGKRHLANMMGVDAVTLAQEDIDKAIAYLMPSGLYEKKARPIMKSPRELYPKEKAAQFDHSGRPFSCFFYARKANFYEAMHQTVEKFTELDAFEDKMLRRGIIEPPEESELYIAGSTWLTINEASNMFLENLTEANYTFMIETLNRLCAHPYAFRCKDFIFKFRKILTEVGELETIPEPIQDESGRLYIFAESKRKSATCKVTVWSNGEGKVKINDLDISYFTLIQDREQLMFPLQFTGLLGQVDFEAVVTGSGHSAQASAIRHALSMCLRSFITPEEVERMRLAGLLTRDKRKRERKKPGQKGARAKYAWVKR